MYKQSSAWRFESCPDQRRALQQCRRCQRCRSPCCRHFSRCRGVVGTAAAVVELSSCRHRCSNRGAAQLLDMVSPPAALLLPKVLLLPPCGCHQSYSWQKNM